MGQHFLYDPAIARKIVDLAKLQPDDVVVELGAGRGILTQALIDKGVPVIALELDRALCGELRERFTRELDRGVDGLPQLELLNVDFTTVSLTTLLVERDLNRCVLMGNIPYNLTREVLFSFLVDEHETINASYLMMQREVADRIVSKPGSRVYGIPSVVLQSLYSVRSLFKVLPGSFVPKPRVKSAVLEFRSLAEPMMAPDLMPPFIRMVKNVFQHRRKTLQNTIKASYSTSASALRDIETASGIDLTKRPEQLSKEELFELFRAIETVTTVNNRAEL